ncbi:uncharacterized protein LOC143175007 [Nomia melanderi]|uniref:uncharacterized protein LOC143175007 n=1 Tax=Nomia melanderi TaxID=2448451 RepID=UPI003FCD38D8
MVYFDFNGKEENPRDDLDEQSRELEQRVLAEGTVEIVPQTRQLCDRRRINAPKRFGFPVAYIADCVPMTYTKAMASPDAEKWNRAINEEIRALEENNTWSLTTMPTAMAAKEDYEIYKFDVKTVFLYGDLEEDLYMQQPDGHIKEGNQELMTDYGLHCGTNFDVY